jgi:hypothetical protein
MSISGGLRGVMILMAGLVVMLSGCGSALPDYRYRLTVEVETPEGLKTGSSVIEVSTSTTSSTSIPSPGAVRHRLNGEAVTIDLGQHGTLFALLRSDVEVDWPTNLLFRLAPQVRVNDENGKYDSDASFRARYEAMLQNRRPIVLPKNFNNISVLRDMPARPMLVRFRDINDPTTVERVDPDALAASFGEGVKLRRVTVQLTDDPVTKGIEKRLKWLDSYRKTNFDRTSSFIEDLTTEELAAHLSSGSFSTEFAN